MLKIQFASLHFEKSKRKCIIEKLNAPGANSTILKKRVKFLDNIFKKLHLVPDIWSKLRIAKYLSSLYELDILGNNDLTSRLFAVN